MAVVSPLFAVDPSGRRRFPSIGFFSSRDRQAADPAERLAGPGSGPSRRSISTARRPRGNGTCDGVLGPGYLTAMTSG